MIVVIGTELEGVAVELSIEAAAATDKLLLLLVAEMDSLDDKKNTSARLAKQFVSFMVVVSYI